jgi:glycosyltransferase involved in cell wall biosynthesis
MRIAALVSHPIQYFSPLFRKLAQQPGVDLTVFFYSRMGLDEKLGLGFGEANHWDTPLLDGYHSIFVPAIQPDRGPVSNWRPFNPGIFSKIMQGHFDVMWVHGHYTITNWLAMVAARLAGTKVLLRSESNLESVPNSWLKRWFKMLTLRLIFQLVDGCLYIGEKNREYYRYYGVPDRKLYLAPYVVDNSFFQAYAKDLASHRDELRRSFGITDDRPVFLFVGKLTEKKQPLLLLKAFAKVHELIPCALLIVGDGHMRQCIEKEIAMIDIPDVHITGFLNQTEVSKAYTAGDILVLPSAWTETWGLVVNEAMNFSLPVIVSDAVGCGPDLVLHGENGYIFQKGSIDDLAKWMYASAFDPQLRIVFAQKSFDRINQWGLDACVNGILTASCAVNDVSN